MLKVDRTFGLYDSEPLGQINKIIKQYIFKTFLMKYLTLRR